MPGLPEVAINQSRNRAVVPASCLVYYGLSSPCRLGHKQNVAVDSHSPVALWGLYDLLRLGLCLV